MPKSLSVIYCFPRSGGTLLSQCLLCEPTNVVLSEVNPAGSVIEPEKQAADWFELITPAKAASLKNLPYIAKIGYIEQCARRIRRHLCLRDWSGLNFLPHISPLVGMPSLQLEQRLYLQCAGYDINEIALVRRSKAIYGSLRSNIPELAELQLPVFFAAYRAYLEQIAAVEKYRLEDLIEGKQKIVREICGQLKLGYARDFENRFHLVKNVTGNTTLPKRPESANWTCIRGHAAPSVKSSASCELSSRKLFQKLDTMAGYEITP